MKALFRCLLAYSDGHPVPVFDMDEDRLHGDETLTAIANSEAALKVAVVRGLSGSDFDAAEWPELLAAAYELFITDRELSSNQIEWVRLKVT
jgi:hypothetical protein